MKIYFFPYDFTYNLRDGKPYVYLFSKLEDGKKICVINHFKPYFYAKVHDIDKEELGKRLKKLEIETKFKAAKVTNWEEIEKELLGKKEKFWKIFVNYPRAVSIVSKELSSWGIGCYEKDILFVHRYLRDKQITPMTLVEAEGKFIEDDTIKIPVFLAENLKQDTEEAAPNIKTLAIDIETYAKDKIVNPEKNPILMVAFYGEDYKKVITWKKFETKLGYLETVDNEVELIKRCKKVIQDYQPDVITGYFSDGFDFPYLRTRADKHKIRLDLGLDGTELVTGRESKIKGILHIDTFKFIRYIFGYTLKTDSYSLDAVSRELLNHQKHDVKIEDLAHVWDNEPEKLEDFCEYNLHDAHLAYQLCQKLLFDMTEFTKIVGLPLFDVTRMRFSRLVESYILKRAFEENVLAPNKPQGFEIDQRVEETYEGAFVYEPTPGMYQDIIIFDFRSLYPTIISAHNIGPEALRCPCCKESKVPGKEEYWFCSKERKFIPKVLERLILRRASLKRLIKETKAKGEDTKILEARSYALKTLANSFYGYLGFFGARWYCLECARSTTAYARNYIKTAIGKANEKGFQVIYADTDSCFLLLGDKNLDQAMEFMDEINSALPEQMELEYEGYYPRGIFVAAKGSEKGAKKKYALISEGGQIKITGFETVRRNWSKVAKEVQQQVLKSVLENKKEEALNYVKEMIKKLKAGKIPLDKFIIKTQITKDLSRYSAISPHVAIARKMQAQGTTIVPGTLIEYIIVKGTGLIRDRAKLPEEVKMGDYDASYYLNNQILPAISSIFAVLGYKEEELVGEESQIKLGEFF